MKVSDLIEQLQQLPQDADIVTEVGGSLLEGTVDIVNAEFHDGAVYLEWTNV